MRRALLGVMILALVLVAVLDVGPLLGIPGAVDAIATVSAGFAFSLLHGYLAWGWKNLLAFVAITLAISFAAEAIGVATGAVFGPYHYTDLFGPRILGVPPVIQIGYLAVGYSSIVMGRIILSLLKPVAGWAIVVASLAGAAIMVGWDVCMDPLQSTAAGDWIWRDGGPYFGVPLSNYAGWFATVFAFMLVYYLFASRTIEAPRTDLQGSPALFWSLPVIYYGLMAFNIIMTFALGAVSLPYAASANYGGTPEQMTGSMALLAIFVMGSPIVFALGRLIVGRGKADPA